MTEGDLLAIEAACARLPAACRFECATEADLLAFETEHGPIPDAFRRFLLRVGGGVVGSEWIDGIAQLPATVTKFRNEAEGWAAADGFPIGWDGAGNPILILPDGTVASPDHHGGNVQTLGESLAGYLLSLVQGAG